MPFAVAENLVKEKEKKSRRGRTARDKGSAYEREIASSFYATYGVELVRTPQSGGFAKNKVSAEGFRGDIVPADKRVEMRLHIECKNQKTWALQAWLEQAKRDCSQGKIPVVIFHKHRTSEDFITLRLEDFLQLVNEERIFKES